MNDARDGQVASRLLLLPYELRAKIYEEVIRSEIPSSQGPAQVSERSREPLNTMSVFYPKDFRHTSSGLMRTSKQIHDEVKAQLEAESRCQKPKCKLDLLVNSPDVYPTWILPPRHRSVDVYDLDVELRLLDLTDPNPLFITQYWPGMISQPLLVIPNRLVAYGPQFFRPVPNFEGLRIHRLTMHVRYCASKPIALRKAPREPPNTPAYVFGNLLYFMRIRLPRGSPLSYIRQSTLATLRHLPNKHYA